MNKKTLQAKLKTLYLGKTIVLTEMQPIGNEFGCEELCLLPGLKGMVRAIRVNPDYPHVVTSQRAFFDVDFTVPVDVYVNFGMMGNREFTLESVPEGELKLA